MAEVWEENGTFPIQRGLVGFDGQLVCGKQSYLGHIEMCVVIARQPQLHGQGEVAGLEQGTAQEDFSPTRLVLNTKVSLFVSGDYSKQDFISRHWIGGSHSENINRNRGVDGEADVVEGDSQRKWQTRGRVLHELALYPLAMTGREKKMTLSLDGGRREAHVWKNGQR